MRNKSAQLLFISLLMAATSCKSVTSKTDTVKHGNTSDTIIKSDIASFPERTDTSSSNPLIGWCWWKPHEAMENYFFFADSTFITSCTDSIFFDYSRNLGKPTISRGTYSINGSKGWLFYKKERPRKFEVLNRNQLKIYVPYYGFYLNYERAGASSSPKNCIEF